MPDTIRKMLFTIRLQLDLPANLRGEAIRLLREFDPARLERLQLSVSRYRGA